MKTRHSKKYQQQLDQANQRVSDAERLFNVAQKESISLYQRLIRIEAENERLRSELNTFKFRFGLDDDIPF